ncbi:MAG: type II toxin-antitoxin system RelE/ParE family toxin [Candidatus Atribacteria bacterium]|nr:type II toxin-antitoxin system RelE/ParE family toxin [Candidatus Atribacteria bacterium]
MSYRIEFERRALQQIKKLPPQICRKVMEKIRTLQENPCRYPLLSTAFSKLRKVVVGASGGEYRIVYALDSKLKLISIVFVGSRENFYKELRRYLD